MRGLRIILFFLMIAVGVLLGLLYGWVISPSTRAPETNPETLRADYRADYVLMVAEIYHADQDLEQAVRRLGLLGSLPPSQMVFEGMVSARELEYSADDMEKMTRLATALESAPGAQSSGDPP
jgi:hypothetical protein